MEFNPARHDFGDKVVLGRQIGGAGLSEFEQTLDALARHPATARHISSLERRDRQTRPLGSRHSDIDSALGV